MNRYMDWNKGMQVLILSGVLGIVLNPSAFRDWAAHLKSESSRKPMLDFATGLDSALQYFGTGVLADSIRAGFLSFSRDYRFTFIQAPQTPKAEPSPLPPPTPVLALSFPNSPLLPTRAPASLTTPAAVQIQEEPVGPPELKPLTRALLLGDSLLKTTLEARLRSTFQQAFPGVTISTFARISTGISRPDVFDWTKKISEFSAQGAYDATYLFLGTNDNQSLYEGDKAYPFLTAKWQSIYLKRARAILESACSFSKRVFWVATPPVRDPALNEDLGQVNSLVEQLIAKDAESKIKDCARFIPSAPGLTGAKGEYATYLKVDERTVQIRSKDGIHLTSDGAGIVANYLAKLARTEFTSPSPEKEHP